MKVHRLIEIFIANGSTFPFKAQWHSPGHAEHGRILTVIGYHQTVPKRFDVGAGRGSLIADPARGIGWNAVDEVKRFGLVDVLALENLELGSPLRRQLFSVRSELAKARFWNRKNKDNIQWDAVPEEEAK